MEFVANLVDSSIDPAAWAQVREDEGWHVVSVADHVADRGRTYPHVWVAAGAMAAATSTVRIASAFANNLLRSPVDVAHAGLAVQQASGGRFELGLGAGWSQPEVEGSGLRYPPPGERVERYAEALQIVSTLLETRHCRFSGTYYQIDIGPIGPPVDTPPTLTASLGGPRSIALCAALVSRVEVKITGRVTRGGTLAYGDLASIDDAHVVDLVERVRRANPDAALSTFIQVGCGNGERLVTLQRDLEGSFLGRFIGEPDRVANALFDLERFGFDRVLLTPYTPDSLDVLAPAILP